MVVAVFCCRNESLHMRFLSVGGGMGIMSVFFGENENKFVLSCELRSGPVWVIFFSHHFRHLASTPMRLRPIGSTDVSM